MTFSFYFSHMHMYTYAHTKIYNRTSRTHRVQSGNYFPVFLTFRPNPNPVYSESCVVLGKIFSGFLVIDRYLSQILSTHKKIHLKEIASIIKILGPMSIFVLSIASSLPQFRSVPNGKSHGKTQFLWDREYSFPWK